MKSTEVFVVIGCDPEIDEIFLSKEDAKKDADKLNELFVKHNMKPYRVLTLKDAIEEIKDSIHDQYCDESY